MFLISKLRGAMGKNCATVFTVGLTAENKSLHSIKSEEFAVKEFFLPERFTDLQDFSNSVFLIHENEFLTSLTSFQCFFGGIDKSVPLIIVGDHFSQKYLEALFIFRPFTFVNSHDGDDALLDAIKNAINGKSFHMPTHDYAKELESAKENIESLHKIGIALSSENDIDKLLDMILTQSRNIAEADAGSLYLVEGDEHLRFKLSQNVSLDWSVKQNSLIDINNRSISGCCANLKAPLNLLDAYKISDRFSFVFNKSYDEHTGYRSRSMLAVPIKNQEGRVLGVIQLINKRTDYENKIPGEPLDMHKVIPFRFDDLELLSSLASQAAVALENLRLYQDIKNVFEGFVKASVLAIESRDPTTKGHSERVSQLTLALASEINNVNSGSLAPWFFDDKKMTELRYATLLQDFGKVGVREEILVKAKKLFAHELEILRNRYKYLKKAIEADFYKQCLDYIVENGNEKFNVVRPSLEAGFREQIDEVNDTLDFLIKANEPSVLEDGNFKHLLEIANRQYFDCHGQMTPFLTERETHVLSIRRGSLSEAERIEIESHVRHTFNFLAKIPWTRNLERIPEIAYAHHEKLNGRGYPNHLQKKEIPFESQMIAVADIFDALTAHDRPYKPAVPLEKALDILYMDVKSDHINKDIVDLFIKRKVYRVIEKNRFR
jgi:HD-GYP domain-containing protein (c-di-GMP phosphodiesterase class II)